MIAIAKRDAHRGAHGPSTCYCYGRPQEIAEPGCCHKCGHRIDRPRQKRAEIRAVPSGRERTPEEALAFAAVDLAPDPLRVTARWLDGPGLVDWLEERGVASHHPHESHRLSIWRKGGRADVATVDRFLVRGGLFLSELPDELFLPNGNGNGNGNGKHPDVAPAQPSLEKQAA